MADASSENERLPEKWENRIVAYEKVRETTVIISGVLYGVHEALIRSEGSNAPFMTTLSALLHGVIYGSLAKGLTKLPTGDIAWLFPVLVVTRIGISVRMFFVGQ